MNIDEALASAGSEPRARYGGGAGSAAPSLSAAMGLDPEIERQIMAATQPEPVDDVPVPKKSKVWQKLASAIADAGSAYAVGMGAGRATNFTGSLLESDASADTIAAGNKSAKERALLRSKKAAAELRLQGLLGRQSREERLADRVEQRKYEQGRDQERQSIEERQRAEDAARRIAEQAAETARLERSARANREHDAAMIRLRDSLEGDKSKQAQKDLDALAEAKGGINEVANSIPQLLQKGMTPAQIRTQIRRSLAQLNLTGDGLKAAQAYVDLEVEPQFEGVAEPTLERQNAPGQGY